MKIRNGFVSNSSSSSFVCDLCGKSTYEEDDLSEMYPYLSTSIKYISDSTKIVFRHPIESWTDKQRYFFCKGCLTKETIEAITKYEDEQGLLVGTPEAKVELPISLLVNQTAIRAAGTKEVVAYLVKNSAHPPEVINEKLQNMTAKELSKLGREVVTSDLIIAFMCEQQGTTLQDVYKVLSGYTVQDLIDLTKRTEDITK